MNHHRKLIIIFLILLIVLMPATAQEQNVKTRILLTPLRNSTNDPNLDLLKEAVLDIMSFTLTLLGNYTVITTPQPLESTQNEILQVTARKNLADNVLFGRVFKNSSGETGLELSVYDRLDNTVVVEHTETSKNMLGTFEAVDRLLIATIEKLSGVHIGWGSIRLTNNGTSGFYDIYIDQFFVGSNKRLIENVLSGERNITIKQERPYNDFTLYEGTVTVPENQTVSVAFTIPGLLDIEESGFTILKNAIRNGIENHDETLEQQFKLAFQLLERAHASEEILTIKKEFEALRHEYTKRKENGVFPDSKKQPDDSKSRETAFIVEKSYGNISLATQTAGTLYMDGKRQGEIPAGGSARLENLETGDYRFEMRYEDGEREIKQVKVEHNRTDSVVFTYQKQYEIGQRGPAGGLVFYDKGEYSNGWRYLEAAPASTEWTKKEWGTYKTSTGATEESIGSGENNTRLITEWLVENGQYGKAAQLCSDLIYGGYDDWFLPSLKEIALMISNLHDQELGGFSDSFYWSSTENSPYSAWKQHFDSARKYYSDKDETYLVRAIRAF